MVVDSSACINVVTYAYDTYRLRQTHGARFDGYRQRVPVEETRDFNAPINEPLAEVDPCHIKAAALA